VFKRGRRELVVVVGVVVVVGREGRDGKERRDWSLIFLSDMKETFLVLVILLLFHLSYSYYFGISLFIFLPFI
jgi:hypothetical protein